MTAAEKLITFSNVLNSISALTSFCALVLAIVIARGKTTTTHRPDPIDAATSESLSRIDKAFSAAMHDMEALIGMHRSARPNQGEDLPIPEAAS